MISRRLAGVGHDSTGRPPSQYWSRAYSFFGGQMTQQHVDTFTDCLVSGKRIYAYCRTGNRSTNLWRASQPAPVSPPHRLKTSVHRTEWLNLSMVRAGSICIYRQPLKTQMGIAGDAHHPVVRGENRRRCGVGCFIALHLHRTSRSYSAEVDLIEGTERFRNVRRYHVQTVPEIIRLRPDHLQGITPHQAK